MGIDAKKRKPTQPKLNHYMKQKVKLDDTNKKNDIFKDCQGEWDKQEDTEEKLTTPLGILEHYKKYTIEERKIIWQKPNRQQPLIGISYEGLEDAKKVELASQVRMPSLCI